MYVFVSKESYFRLSIRDLGFQTNYIPLVFSLKTSKKVDLEGRMLDSSFLGYETCYLLKLERFMLLLFPLDKALFAQLFRLKIRQN